MISTTDLTGTQLLQLDALLADTTLGGGVYRPPVATDNEVLRELVDAGLAYIIEGFFDHYELTDLGREIVLDRARDAAESEAFVRCASRHELRESICRLKAVFNDLTDPVLRDRTLQDIEACQDRLDDLDDGPSESTGRHRLVEVDDRPTETIDRVEPPTEPMPLSGTLPGIPVAEILTDREGAERLLAAIQDMPSPADVAEYLAEPHTNAEWAALEADLADESSWWQRNVTDRLTPRRKIVLAIVGTVVVTWFAAWLVIG